MAKNWISAVGGTIVDNIFTATLGTWQACAVGESYNNPDKYYVVISGEPNSETGFVGMTNAGNSPQTQLWATYGTMSFQVSTTNQNMWTYGGFSVQFGPSSISNGPNGGVSLSDWYNSFWIFAIDQTADTITRYNVSRTDPEKYTKYVFDASGPVTNPNTIDWSTAKPFVNPYRVSNALALRDSASFNGIPSEVTDIYTEYGTPSNTAPTDIILSSNSISENENTGTVVCTLSSIDIDEGDTFIYTLVSGTGDDNNSSFYTSGSQLYSNESFDKETKNTYSIRLRTTDAGGLYFEKEFTINITNVNEVPTNMYLDRDYFNEDDPNGTVIGKLYSIDPDIGDVHTYTLIDGPPDNAYFGIINNTLVVSGDFDYDTKSIYYPVVKSTDAGGLFMIKTFPTFVIKANESPSDLLLSNNSILENLPVDSVIGNLTSSPSAVSSTKQETIQTSNFQSSKYTWDLNSDWGGYVTIEIYPIFPSSDTIIDRIMCYATEPVTSNDIGVGIYSVSGDILTLETSGSTTISTSGFQVITIDEITLNCGTQYYVGALKKGPEEADITLAAFNPANDYSFYFPAAGDQIQPPYNMPSTLDLNNKQSLNIIVWFALYNSTNPSNILKTVDPTNCYNIPFSFDYSTDGGINIKPEFISLPPILEEVEVYGLRTYILDITGPDLVNYALYKKSDSILNLVASKDMYITSAGYLDIIFYNPYTLTPGEYFVAGKRRSIDNEHYYVGTDSFTFESINGAMFAGAPISLSAYLPNTQFHVGNSTGISYYFEILTNDKLLSPPSTSIIGSSKSAFYAIAGNTYYSKLNLSDTYTNIDRMQINIEYVPKDLSNEQYGIFEESPDGTYTLLTSGSFDINTSDAYSIKTIELNPSVNLIKNKNYWVGTVTQESVVNDTYNLYGNTNYTANYNNKSGISFKGQSTSVLQSVDTYNEAHNAAFYAQVFSSIDSRPLLVNSFEITSGDTNSFQVSGDQLLSSEIFDYEVKDTYNIGLKVTNFNNLELNGSYTINIINVSASVSAIELSNYIIPEFYKNGSTIATITARGVIELDSYEFYLIEDGDGAVEIEGDLLKVKDYSKINKVYTDNLSITIGVREV